MLRFKLPFTILFLIIISISNFGLKALAQQKETNLKNQFQPDLAKTSEVLKGKLVNLPNSLAGTINKVHARIESFDVDGEYSISCPIQHDGTFKVELEYSLPIQEILIEIGSYRDWIPVHGSVEATFDFESFDQTGKPVISFAGKRSDWSNYMYRYATTLQKYESKDSLRKRIDDLIEDATDTASFLRVMGKWKTQMANFTEEYYKKYPPKPEIKQVLKTTNQAKHLSFLARFYWLSYQPLPERFAKSIEAFNENLNVLNYTTNTYLYYLSCYMRTDWERKGVDLPVEMFIDEMLELDTLSAEGERHLKRTGELYQRYRRDKANGSDVDYTRELDSNIQIFNTRYGSILNPRIRRWMKENNKTRTDYFLSQFPGIIGEILVAKSGPRKDQLTVDSLESAYRNLLTYVKTPAISYFIQRYVNTVKQATVANTNSAAEATFETNQDFQSIMTRVDFEPYAELYFNASLGGNELFDYLIRTHQGKLLFIDFWATWCAPCLDGFEKAKQLKKDLNQSQLSFIYFCADSEKEEWIGRIRENRLEGLHIYLTKAQQQTLFRRFKFHGYPSYLFIDKSGKIEFNAKRLLDNPVKGTELIKQKLMEK